MPICSNCKSEYINGKKICSYCGEELYKGLLTDLSEDKNVVDQVRWSRVSCAETDEDADMIIKQLMSTDIPAIKKTNGMPFEEFGAFQSNSSIEILVPQGMENKADVVLN